ncbi:MAG: addiction module protein [Roseateles sp.]
MTTALESLQAEAAWEEIADAREAELEAGAATAVPLEAVVARLEARFLGRCIRPSFGDKRA